MLRQWTTSASSSGLPKILTKVWYLTHAGCREEKRYGIGLYFNVINVTSIGLFQMRREVKFLSCVSSMKQITLHCSCCKQIEYRQLRLWIPCMLFNSLKKSDCYDKK